jgi:putative addiction module CopG family antidote
MTRVTLPPELERFATEAVAQGRYRDVSEVIAVALARLQRFETERAAFAASLDDAIAEGERDGFFTIEEVEREMDQIIEAAVRTQR